MALIPLRPDDTASYIVLDIYGILTEDLQTEPNVWHPWQETALGTERDALQLSQVLNTEYAVVQGDWLCSHLLRASKGTNVKHLTLTSALLDGKKSFQLIGPEGRIGAFDTFAATLTSAPYNTRSTYCRGLAAFLNYLVEASSHLQKCHSTLNRESLLLVLRSFSDYLIFGANAESRLARDVNSTMPSPLITRSSCETMLAGVRRFLEISEIYRRNEEQLQRHGLSNSEAVDPVPLQSQTSRTPDHFQNRAILNNSMFAGVVAGGPRLLSEAILPGSKLCAQSAERHPFPFNYVVSLINAMPSWRDKALYALCAACGCRISEATQTLWQDIDPNTGTVRLVDPARRPNDMSYMALQLWERDKLMWKGRSTQATLLIEPFSSMFFEAIEQYMRKEYVPHGHHQFIFQYRHNNSMGRPYFLCADSSRTEIFRTATKKCLPAKLNQSHQFGAHSLRHMYGTYLLNYFPKADGSHGLPIGIVRQLMGHKNVQSTAVYARHDIDLLQIELAHTNAFIFHTGQTKSLSEFKRDALQAKLIAVEKEISLEKLMGV